MNKEQLQQQLQKLKSIPFQHGEPALFTDDLEEEGYLYGFDRINSENERFPYSPLGYHFNFKYVKRLARFIYAEPNPKWTPNVGDVVWIKERKEVARIDKVEEGQVWVKGHSFRAHYFFSEVQEFTMNVFDEQS